MTTKNKASLLTKPPGLWEIERRPYYAHGMAHLKANLPWGYRNTLWEAGHGHEVFQQSGFELGPILGHGTFSLVVMAHWIQYRQNVAVKIYTKNKGTTAKSVLKMLPVEIEMLKKLKHPNIVGFYGAWETKLRVYLVMELLGFGTMLEYLQKYDRVEESRGKVWFSQLVSGVKYIHDLEIAHRDIKLENLLLDMQQNVRITDFGFATPDITWAVDIPNSGWSKVTDYRGSKSYMAPEIIFGVAYNPILADVWAMGVVLYCILFGKFPLGDFTPESLDKMVKKFRIPDIPDISYDCKRVLRSIFKFETDRIRSIDLLECDWLLERVDDIILGRKAKLKRCDVNWGKQRAERQEILDRLQTHLMKKDLENEDDEDVMKEKILIYGQNQEHEGESNEPDSQLTNHASIEQNVKFTIEDIEYGGEDYEEFHFHPHRQKIKNVEAKDVHSIGDGNDGQNEDEPGDSKAGTFALTAKSD